MKKRSKCRPCASSERSISKMTDQSQIWAKTVEKPMEQEAPLAVEPLLVSEKTTAKLLGISPRTVWALAARGELEFQRIGRRKLFSVKSLKAFADGGKEVK